MDSGPSVGNSSMNVKDNKKPEPQLLHYALEWLLKGAIYESTYYEFN